MKKIIFSLVCLFLISSASAFAQSTKAITKTQKLQKHKIKQGVKSGELTKREVKKLKAQQRNIQKTKLRVKADGIVTKREKKTIMAKQKRANKTIYREKHNAAKR